MLSSAASTLLRLGGWSYIPDFAARNLLNAYHQALRSRGKSVPQKGTLPWQKHYRVAFAIVVLGYLGYNLVEAARSTPPNFFEVLGVPPYADENALKSAFRSFAKKNHPDRVGPEGAATFIAVRDAYEALKNPITRFAYERFGPDALVWRECASPKDFLKRGLTQASGFYIGTSAILLLMSAALKPSPVAFWRYLLLANLFALELCFVLGYKSSGILGAIFPNRVPFQNVLLLHQVFVFLSVALTRVIPVIFPEAPSIRPEDPRAYAPFLERLTALAKVADREVSRMLHIELHSMHGTASSASFSNVTPCEPTDDVMDVLTREMENMIVEHQLRVEPPIRSLWDAAIKRQRDEASRQPKPPASDELSDDDGIEPGAVVQKPAIKIPQTNGRLPSPPMSVSPESRFMQLANGDEEDGRSVDAGINANLPSPRPSPPPAGAHSRPISPSNKHQMRRSLSPVIT